MSGFDEDGPITFEEAKREAIRTVVSVSGRSGSGKTYSSLLLARGLAGPEGKVFVLDTEAKRSLMYADDPDIGGFRVGHMRPPFTPDSYIATIDAAEKAGADVIVVDSASHEWTGIGGCIEWAEKIQSESRKQGPTAWIKPKCAHRRLVNRLLQAQCHLVLCLRADYKLVAFTDDKGKQAFAESNDLVPEQEKRFIYEMTISAIVDADHRARFVKLPKPLLGKLEDGQIIGVSTGEAIRAWVKGGEAIDRDMESQLAVCRDVASMGRGALEMHWKSLDHHWKGRLKPHMAEMGRIASEADRIGASTRNPDDDFPGDLPSTDTLL